MSLSIRTPGPFADRTVQVSRLYQPRGALFVSSGRWGRSWSPFLPPWRICVVEFEAPESPLFVSVGGVLRAVRVDGGRWEEGAREKPLTAVQRRK